MIRKLYTFTLYQVLGIIHIIEYCRFFSISTVGMIEVLRTINVRVSLV